MLNENFDWDNCFYDQYKLMFQSSEKISEQRIRNNNFYLTYNTIISTIIFSLIEFKMISIESYLLMGILLILCLSNFIWVLNLKYYRNLNEAKFKIINRMENKLPVKLFTEEWDILEKKKHVAISKMEQLIPIILIFFFILATYYICYIINRTLFWIVILVPIMVFSSILIFKLIKKRR
jgi:hypothetical protein